MAGEDSKWLQVQPFGDRHNAQIKAYLAAARWSGCFKIYSVKEVQSEAI